MTLTERIIYWLLIISFALGNLYKFSFFSPDVRISFLDISVFLIASLLLIKHLGRLKEIYIADKIILKPFLTFSLIAFISLLFALPRFGFTAFLVGGMYLGRFIFLGLFFICLKQTFTTYNLRKLLITLGLTVLVTGIGQYLFSPDVRSLAVSEWDPHYFRVVGTILDPGFIGEMLLLFIIYLFTRPLKNLKLNVFLIFLTYAAFSLTYSRSSFLAAFLALAFFAQFKKSWKTFIIGSVVLGVTLLILPRAPGGEGVKLERTSSIEARILNWKNTLAVISRNPVLGVGFDTYRYAQKHYGFLDNNVWLKSHAGAGADSSLLFVTATTGIIGLVFYLLFLKSLWSVIPVNMTLRLSLVSLLVHSVFLNSLFYPFILVWLAILTAVSVKGYK
jgi:O-antigen ligase